MTLESASSKPLKAAIIGLGKMGIVHAATIRTHPGVDLCAFCDTSKFMVQSIEKFISGLRFYQDYREMLGHEELDVVFITTPTSTHAEIAEFCAAAGKHVFVEKPLGTDLTEAKRVDDAARKAGVQTQVGYVCRYAPTFEKAKEILDSGAIGRVMGFGSVKYSSDVQRKVEKSWRFMRKSSGGGGGVVNEFACHGVDLLVWMFGEPTSVTSKLESWYSSEVEDYVHAVFDYGDFSGWIDSSWSMQDFRKPYNKIEVTGDNGKLIVTDSEIRWLVNRQHAGHEAGWFSNSITDLYESTRIFVGDIMFTRQADAFLGAIDGGPPARSPVPDALRTQGVLEAIREGDKL
jgi:predicted dehydrogenase